VETPQQETIQAQTEPAAPAPESSGLRTLRTWMRDLFFSVIVSFFIILFVYQPVKVEGGSMEPGLEDQERIVINKLVYRLESIERGDIIVFRYPLDPQVRYVKRVIGIPGDRIHMENQQVIRNGQRLIEPHTRHIARWPDRYRDNFPQGASTALPPRALDMLERRQRNGEIIVPEGSLFAMGDNRDDSADSRYWGFVPRENVIGKPLVVYWSYDAPSEDLMDWNLRHLVDVGLHFFTKTRWERTLLLPRSQAA